MRRSKIAGREVKMLSLSDQSYSHLPDWIVIKMSLFILSYLFRLPVLLFAALALGCRSEKNRATGYLFES